ncbi:MerR family transcriptional regulator [Oharaeibacter diazotrophicus]|uniref:MerR family transcriptional regulator n=1 Tax=Oharaeibacter diazotrophicus TaxID=1920512 RepID=UPI000F830760|nr:MerR family transcriptional regulator [Oharaeibacter diazotrophicus]GLS76562.1 transcriptional regulator [Oharaeibacter diazotrophicus]
MKIGELARRTGLSAHTLRYYERIGLLPLADRDGGRRRDYDAAILAWIDFVGRLRTTGMPIREMVRYAELRALGAHTGAERRALLEAHRERVRAHVADLTACLLVLDGKIAGYADAEQGIADHDADPTDHARDDHPGNGRARDQPARTRPPRARGDRR